MIRKLISSFKIRPFDWLLVIGLVLAPMTSLRIWKVGPSETLVFLWTLRFVKRKLILSDVARFYFVFLFTQILGSFWCLLVAPQEAALALHFTWFYLGFVSIYMYDGLCGYELEYCKKLFSLFANLSVVWYLFLFFYARYIGPQFMGAQLWFGSMRFSGGATNPHQVAVLMCGLSMFYLRDAFHGQRILLSLLKMAACVFIVVQTRSSSGILAVALGAFTGLVLLSTTAVKGTTNKRIVFLFEFVIAFLVVLFMYRKFYQLFYDWIASDSNGLSRFYLFAQTKNAFFKSPIVGLGPGWHVFTMGGEPIEIHNTYLEILASAGIIGLLALILFTVRQVRQIIRVDVLYLPIIVSIYAYGLAGFALRRLVYWGFTVFILVIVRKEINKHRLVNTSV